MLRFISAFLFALTLLAAGAVGFWFYTVEQAQERLQQALPEMVGSEISYTGVEEHYVLGRIQLTLKDVVLSSPEVRLQVGDVLFESDFFGQYKLSLKLPKWQTLQVLAHGQPVKTYKLQMENGNLQLFPDLDEMVFSYLSLSAEDEEGERLRTGIVDMSLRQLEDGVLDTTVTLKNVQGKPLGEGSEVDIPSFLFKGQIARLPETWADWVMALLKAPTLEAWQTEAATALNQLQAQKTQVVMENWIYRDGDESCVLHGRVGLDQRLRLIGTLEVLFSQPNMLTESLDATQILGPQDLSLNAELNRVLSREQQAPYTYRMRMVRGDMLVDGVKLGVMAPLPEVMGLVAVGPVEMEPIAEETSPNLF